MGIVMGVIALVLVGGGAYYAWQSRSTPAPVETPAPVVPVDERVTFASSTMGISFKYPPGFVLADSYSNISVNPKKPIAGVKLTLPLAMATGTNLSADSGISIEQLPRANNCTGDIYLAANVRPKKIVEGAVTYSLATSSEGAAGNVYEEWIYAVASSSPCTAVRYFLHSTQVGNYATGTVRAFDRAALLAEFDKIRQSLVLQ